MTPDSDRPENPSGPPSRSDGTPDEGPIWCTQWPSDAKNIFSVSYRKGSSHHEKFVRDWQHGAPLDPATIPAYLVLEEGRPVPKRDLFAIQAMIMVISERLADIFRQFDLGPAPTDEEPRPRRTELHTMPLFAHDERTLIRKVVFDAMLAGEETGSFLRKRRKPRATVDEFGQWISPVMIRLLFGDPP